MAFSRREPEKVPETEKLKKTPKRPSRNSRKKCLACRDGKILFYGVEYDCSACSGSGFII